MATFTKRRNADGSTSWDALVRVVGYPTTSRSFPTKLAAELWASRTESARRGRTAACPRGMTLGQLIDDALSRLTNPTAAVFAYWRAELGDVRLEKTACDHPLLNHLVRTQQQATRSTPRPKATPQRTDAQATFPD